MLFLHKIRIERPNCDFLENSEETSVYRRGFRSSNLELSGGATKKTMKNHWFNQWLATGNREIAFSQNTHYSCAILSILGSDSGVSCVFAQNVTFYALKHRSDCDFAVFHQNATPKSLKYHRDYVCFAKATFSFTCKLTNFQSQNPYAEDHIS